MAPLISIAGTVSYCPNPTHGPLANVTLNLTGSATGTTITDGSGNYALSSLASGGNYTVTPFKTGLTPGGSGAAVNTIDIIAAQRHFLQVTLLTGCRLAAGDVNGDSTVNTIDIVAMQRFFLGLSTGIANTGHYVFTPASRNYPGTLTSQAGQDFDAMVLGDVATPFAAREAGPAPNGAENSMDAPEVPSSVSVVALPNVAVDTSMTGFVAGVTTTLVDANDNVVGFQGDFTFDSTLIAFEDEPVQKAGLTAGNWTVAGHVLSGPGPIKTLRVSGFSNDLEPLSGSGTLFELRMERVTRAGRVTQMLWAAPPDHFIFIDADLNTLKPHYAAPGSLTPSLGRKEVQPETDTAEANNSSEPEAEPTLDETSVPLDDLE